MAEARSLVFALAILLVAPPLTLAAEYVPGEVLVKFSPSSRLEERSVLRASLADRVLSRFDRFGIEHWKLRDQSVDATVEQYRSHPAFTYVERNYLLYPQLEPNDSLYSTNQSNLPLIGCPAAWGITTGDPNLLFGVLDSGVDFDHPDLAANMWVNTREIPCNGVDDDGNGYIDDLHGYDFVKHMGIPHRDSLGNCIPFSAEAWWQHGTGIAGTAAAVTNNAEGIAGVSWGSRIVSIRVIDESNALTLAALIAGMEYSLVIGCRLTNNSYGAIICVPMLEDVLDLAGASGQIYVAAAGNGPPGIDVDTTPSNPSGEPPPVLWPAAYTSRLTIIVGGSNGSSLPPWLNYGKQSVDLFAPQAVISTSPGGQYGGFGGTSFATAHVTGALALLLSENPAITVADAKARLLASVDPFSSMANKCVSGGRLNVASLLQQSATSADPTAPAAVTDLCVGLGASATIVSWTAPGDDGSSGTPASYELRYSTSPITAANFLGATRVCWSPPMFPSLAGSYERTVLAPLPCGWTYYFALRTRDEWGNISGLSNVWSGYRQCSPASFECEGGEGAQLEPVVASGEDPILIREESGPDRATFQLLIPQARFGEVVEIGVYDVQGRRVEFLHRGVADQDVARVSWDHSTVGGAKVGQGVYVVRFRLGPDQWTRPVVVLR